MEDEALENETDGVQCRGNDEDGKSCEQAEARAKTGSDAGFAEPGAVDAQDDDRCGDEPEERDQRDGGKSEGQQAKDGSDAACQPCTLNRAAPDDGVVGSGGLRDRVGERVGGGLLGADLLIDLLAKLFGELDLGCSTVPAIYKGALIFAMQKGVTTGTDARTHYCEG